jgi:hypothetical protein
MGAPLPIQVNRPSLIILMLGCLALCGCARHYVVKLSNGSEFDTRSKPKLVDGSYYFKDGLGRDSSIPASRVVEVAPASMAHEDEKTFTPPKAPKKRHWYFLWLGVNSSEARNESEPS